MSGFVIAYGTCLRCGRPFSFNPNKVPSMRVEGSREPICRGCFDALNAKRKEMGMTLWTLEPDAYAPLPEAEL